MQWLSDNGAALQSGAAIASLAIIFFTARQVRDASAQRDVADSFEFSKKIDDLLGVWSQAKQSARRRELGALLVPLEVAAASINHSRFSKITRYFMRHQVKDVLVMIAAEADTSPLLAEWMRDPEVCRHLRLFLVENYALMRRAEGHQEVLAIFFADRRAHRLWQDSWRGRLARLWYALRLRWGLI